MMPSIDLKEVERRAQRAFYEDGLAELLIGLFLFVVGGGMSVGSSAAILIPFFILFFRPVSERLKERYIYPRIGYAKFKEESSDFNPAWVIAIVGGLMVSILGSYFLTKVFVKGETGTLFWYNRVAPVLVGLMMAISLSVVVFKYRIYRYGVFSLLAIASGFGLPFLVENPVRMQVIGLQFTVVGGVIVVTGAVLFAIFIRRHPVVDLEVPDGG